MFGPVGVGKTHIAQALGHLAVRQGAHVRFAKTSRTLAGGHADRTWEKTQVSIALPMPCHRCNRSATWIAVGAPSRAPSA
ncbi:ATP-binding protein [Streptomyces sp. NPDC088358]|uniref:ATP-binding protein n=1 Tax=Streptomyces sp. NPDC088358 TaxID=3365857 RepID=UPI003808A1C1